MDIRWLQSCIIVKGPALTFKASKNLGQVFRKADCSFMTFEVSEISLIHKEGEGVRKEAISASFLKHDQ